MEENMEEDNKRPRDEQGETRCVKPKLAILVGTETTSSKLPIAIAFDYSSDSEDAKEDPPYGPFEGTSEQRIASLLEHLKHYEEANLLGTLPTINLISMHCFKCTAEKRLNDFVMNSMMSKESALKELAELMVFWGCW